MNRIKLKTEIEKAIRETLVIQNKNSVHFASDRIIKLIESNITTLLR